MPTSPTLPTSAFPGAPEAVAEVADRMFAAGTRNIVLMSGRGAPEAQRAEGLLADLASTHDATWGAVRCAFLMQNFDEGFFAELIALGEVPFPADLVREPFVDAEDVADVAAALMLGEVQGNRPYELTGPELLTFAEATAHIAKAAGHPIAYVPITVEEYVAGMVAAGMPTADAQGLGELFCEELDGRNEQLADGVEARAGQRATRLRKLRPCCREGRRMESRADMTEPTAADRLRSGARASADAPAMTFGSNYGVWVGMTTSNERSWPCTRSSKSCR